MIMLMLKSHKTTLDSNLVAMQSYLSVVFFGIAEQIHQDAVKLVKFRQQQLTLA